MVDNNSIIKTGEDLLRSPYKDIAAHHEALLRVIEDRFPTVTAEDQAGLLALRARLVKQKEDHEASNRPFPGSSARGI